MDEVETNNKTRPDPRDLLTKAKSKVAKPDAARAGQVSNARFRTLAKAHFASVAGDALLAIALADSLFFSVNPNDARWKVGLYLLVTIAPFAIVAPLLGPIMDRVSGGHRYMIIGSSLIRAFVMAALVVYVQEWALFPLAFAMLVMGKTYAVAKSAVVPSLVSSADELVKSNSRLSILSAAAATTAGIPGLLLLRFGGAEWVLGFGVIVFFIGAYLAFQIPSVTVAATPAKAEEKVELKGKGIPIASAAMAFLRSASGFITMLLAFDLRGGVDPGPTSSGVELGHRVRESMGFERLDLTTGGAPPWHFGLALVGVGIGGIIGSLGVPRLRKLLAEERILAFLLALLTGIGALAVMAAELVGVFLMSAGIALAAQGGKQAFDAIVQRDAPRANLGRTFSRFESRFQLVWVIGALIPVVIAMPARVGYIIVAAGAALVAVVYWFGRLPNPAALMQRRQPVEPEQPPRSEAAPPVFRKIADKPIPKAKAEEPQIRKIVPKPERDLTANPERYFAPNPESKPNLAPKPERERELTAAEGNDLAEEIRRAKARLEPRPHSEED